MLFGQCNLMYRYQKVTLPYISGELTIDCKDPDGLDVPVHLTDNYDGTYRLRVRPEKPGKHILSIRLNNKHVLGEHMNYVT